MAVRLPTAKTVVSGMRHVVRRSIPIALVLAVVATAGAAGVMTRHWLSTSPRFAVSSLQIRGNHVLSDQQVQTTAGIANDNIFSLGVSELEQRLISSAWVQDARVERQLPNQLRITIVEHTPAAIVEMGGLYLVDEEGHAFKRLALSGDEGTNLPVITGISRDDYRLSPDRVRDRVKQALEALRLFAANEERPRIGEVNADVKRGLTLVTYESAVSIRLGHSAQTRLPERFWAFDATWKALTPDEKNTVSVIYVNSDAACERVSVAFAMTRSDRWAN